MRARVKWVEDATFVGETGSGHAIVIDGPPESGGRNLGPRPMELMLLSLGSCASFDVVHILKKGRQNIHDCVAEVEGQRAQETPAVFTDIHLHFVVTGHDLVENRVEKAVALSAEKYCSATLSINETVNVTHSYEIKSQS